MKGMSRGVVAVAWLFALVAAPAVEAQTLTGSGLPPCPAAGRCEKVATTTMNGFSGSAGTRVVSHTVEASQALRSRR